MPKPRIAESATPDGRGSFVGRACAWGIVLLILGVLVLQAWRFQRFRFVTATPDWSGAPIANAENSPSGYAGNTRMVIATAHDGESYRWIQRAQEIAAGGARRVRTIEVENAPFGRPSYQSSLYPWVLVAAGWLDHLFTDIALPLGIERALGWLNPCLQAVLLSLLGFWTLRKWGPLSGFLLVCVLVGWMPAGAAFGAGIASPLPLSYLVSLASLLALVFSLGPARSHAIEDATVLSRGVGLSGLLAGLNLAFRPDVEVVALAGLFLAGLIIESNRAGGSPAIAWRQWARVGAITSVLFYLLEFAPGHFSWRLEGNHPLHALGWVAGAECLMFIVRWRGRGSTPIRLADRLFGALGFAGGAAWAAALWMTSSGALFSPDPGVKQWLALMPVEAASLLGLANVPGGLGLAMATALPVLVLLSGSLLWLRMRAGPGWWLALLLSLGTVVIFLIQACFQLRAWTPSGILAGGLAAVLVGVSSPLSRLWKSAVATVVFAGVAAGLVSPASGLFKAVESPFGPYEVRGVVERDLAHWLARRSPEPNTIVAAAPDLTAAFTFHGGFRGFGSLGWENQAAFVALVRLVNATSLDEAQELVRNRQLGYIVMPSWDPFLEALVHADAAGQDRSFLGALHRWDLPAWLQPISYPMPAIAGFEHQSVVILQVVEEQEAGVAASRQAEYFIEMGHPDLAEALRAKFLSLPGDLYGLVGLIQLDLLKGDRVALGQDLEMLEPLLTEETLAAMKWDRRVQLAVVLATVKRVDLAGREVRACVESMDPVRLKTVSATSLYRLLLLAKRFSVPVPVAARARALEMLPVALQKRLTD